MAKFNPFIKLITLLITLSFSSISNATLSNNAEADALFTRIDNGEAVYDNELYLNLLNQIEPLIAKNDVNRQLRLARARCWSHNIFEPGQIAKALDFAKHALTHPQLSSYPNHKLGLELCQTWYAERDGDVESALNGYNNILRKAYALEDLRLVADSRAMRGYLHSFQGNFSQALEDLISAQSLYDNLDLPIFVEINLYEIAKAYRRFGDQKSAIRYFRKLEQIKRKNNNFDSANTMLASIAIAEEELGNLHKSKALFEQSYQYWQKKGDDSLKATVAVNIAGTLIKLGEFKQAKKYLAEAEPIILENDPGFYSYMHLFYAQIYLAEKQLEQAHNSVALSRAAFSSLKNASGLAQLLQIETQIFREQGLWQRAFNSQTAYIEIHNQIDDKLLSSYTTEMRTRFNTEQIENENRHLIENQKLRELELTMLEQNKLQQGIIIALGGLLIVIISLFAYKQSQKNKLLSALALTDDLTQLPNRRYIYNKAQRCFEEALIYERPLSFIAFDADYFKRINDTYGHEVGDNTLKFLADSCRAVLGTKYIAARVGGEEFLVVLPNTDKAQAINVAEELVQRIRNANFSSFPEGFSITISAGVSSLEVTDNKLLPLLKRADDALYHAKHQGRDQVKSL
ncbi:tetratricopeptide repeat-containing diguanylate cyclase [Shewanella fidelis]|uniref:diguanylate cyclase n=1 Tax=Shewanella fidelis TaxID=173509 RepID=A0AAW8NLH7_9GAMM|nr:tetratricopeptide repeat-containing diguanylate cyclase [Shewanella fidelis]MDR8522768.1 diguanylate cyclase [Shewanella fidelis]MDW4812383.1 diguanylate cyclase [Shewanella fidelis]MDW4815952.1 diguanylate cyclase [Shewanella fidelis]MDW4820624.1 diguanylate cyclase [Shewanella fidelis]MDW4824846.1 diguanylate cyclase [Shewanella fidelis]